MGNKADIVASVHQTFQQTQFSASSSSGKEPPRSTEKHQYFYTEWLEKCFSEVKDLGGGNKEIKRCLSPVHFYTQIFNEEHMGQCI